MKDCECLPTRARGLRMLLSLDPELAVVGEAENGEEALLLERRIGRLHSRSVGDL